MSQTLLEMAKDLVMAQIEAHRLSPEEMHQALHQTYASLQALKAQEDANGSVAIVITRDTTRASQLAEKHYQAYGDVSGVWSQFQATVGETSEGTWVGWTVISRQVWHSTDTTVSSQRDHSDTEGDRAESRDRGRKHRRL